LALTAFCLVCDAISVMDAVNSSMEPAYSVEPWDRVWLPSDTCFEPEDT
jgi:hypothetical protein